LLILAEIVIGVSSSGKGLIIESPNSTLVLPRHPYIINPRPNARVPPATGMFADSPTIRRMLLPRNREHPGLLAIVVDMCDCGY
jgi:hypothetical protein